MDGKADKVSYRAFKKRIEIILKKSKKITKPMKKNKFYVFWSMNDKTDGQNNVKVRCTQITLVFDENSSCLS